MRPYAWSGLALALLAGMVSVVAQEPVFQRANPAEAALLPANTTPDREPVTPVPEPPAFDRAKLLLGEALFHDRRLSHDGTLSCNSCHDLATNGAGGRPASAARSAASPQLDTPTVFNVALSFRLDWEGDFHTLEAQAAASLRNPATMGTNSPEFLQKLQADPDMVHAFRTAYGHAPDEASLLDAIATFERSLLTPNGRFDRWLRGDSAALSADEKAGYALFKSLGCVSCHQGVNVGGNLFERHGIFRPLASPKPEIVRVPSLRNVATTAPYFHDGSAPTLQVAVRRMAAAQLDQQLTDEQIRLIVAFLNTLTGEYRGIPVKAPAP